ncbi:hypothetical protein CASFOL_037611 [Castilleja foliolosa]|uniref:Uncharacterized protein n=1 Tax=Castilleja foliolosa TaxID=1961234 RepID=A0ABD3BMU4_9LAMI
MTFNSKGKYGIRNAYWQEDEAFDHDIGMNIQDSMDKPWKPLTRKIKVSPDLDDLKVKLETPSQANRTGRSDLLDIDVFVSSLDPDKESPLVIANTILSILAVEYLLEKLSIYVSDDGGAILTFETMVEAVKFVKREVVPI